MKKILRLAAATACILVIGNLKSSAQTNQADANAYATIVQPITITNQNDLNFGDLVASSTAGQAILSYNGSAAVVGTNGGVTTSAAPVNTPMAAYYIVNGQTDYLYNITLPADGAVILTNTTTGTTMDLINFTHWTSSAGAGSTTNTLFGGSDELYVGATLEVGANQAPGLYQTTSVFTVTVNYE